MCVPATNNVFASLLDPMDFHTSWQDTFSQRYRNSTHLTKHLKNKLRYSNWWLKPGDIATVETKLLSLFFKYYVLLFLDRIFIAHTVLILNLLTNISSAQHSWLVKILNNAVTHTQLSNITIIVKSLVRNWQMVAAIIVTSLVRN